MLQQLLELRGYCAYSVSVEKLASEMVSAIKEKRADMVVISALPPAAVTHARYLCKRIHFHYPDADMVVGLWLYRGDIKKARDRVTCAGKVQVVTSLKDIQTQIDQLAQPLLINGGAPTPLSPAHA